MGIRRTAIWLFACTALVVMTSRALAQPAHSNLNYQVPHPTYENGPAPFSNDNPGSNKGLSPFHPVGFEPQFDWFAPAETSGYGRGPRPHIGYFFSYERLFWSMSSPEKAYIGSEDGPFNPAVLPVALPSVDNRWIRANGGWGNRWELGYIDTDDYGWLVSVLDHVSQSNYQIVQDPSFSLGDPLGLLSGVVPFNVTDSDPVETVTVNVGTLPFQFGEFRMNSHVRLNGVELSRFYRARKLHNGSYFELLYGVRWFQIDDAVIIEGDGNGTNPENITLDFIGLDPSTFTIPMNILDGSIWSNRVLNNLVGPQIGVRFFRQRGRWVTSLSTRFLAAANFQNIILKTDLGNQTVANQGAINNNVSTSFRGLGADMERNVTTFAPMGELRVNVAWQATRNVGLKVGYTGLVVGGIARASNTIDYDSPDLIGIRRGNNHQVFFVNGLNFGVEINR